MTHGKSTPLPIHFSSFADVSERRWHLVHQQLTNHAPVLGTFSRPNTQAPHSLNNVGLVFSEHIQTLTLESRTHLRLVFLLLQTLLAAPASGAAARVSLFHVPETLVHAMRTK